jgi:peptidase E
MKLFLASLAISDSQAIELAKLVGKRPQDIKLGHIENAVDTYAEKDRAWFYNNRRAIESHGFDVERIDLRRYKGKAGELKAVLSGKDVIWCGGGNTYYLRWILRDAGADAIISDLAKRGVVYGGGSAIVAGPTLKHFETADDPHEAPEAIYEGMSLTDKVIVPHMDNAKFAAIIHGINQALLDDGFKTAPLGDAQALVMDGDIEKTIR